LAAQAQVGGVICFRPWESNDADDWIRHSLKVWSHRSEFAFSELDLETIEILCHPENIASRRVAESLDAISDGIHSNRIELHGAIVDAVVCRIESCTDGHRQRIDLATPDE
jgi:hypothetical protein